MKKTKILMLFVLIALSITTIYAAKAPEFTFETFGGKRVKSTTLLEKGPIFLDFWGTTCEPCLKALPHISGFVAKYPEMNFVGINLDSPRNKDKAQKLFKANKYEFIDGYDENKAMQNLFGVKDMPRTIIIDTDGEIVYDNSSFTPGDEEKYEKLIKDILSKD